VRFWDNDMHKNKVPSFSQAGKIAASGGAGGNNRAWHLGPARNKRRKSAF